MSRRVSRTTTLPPVAKLTLLALLLPLGACDVPNFEGPQLQDPPQGFLLQPDSWAPRSMFQHLPEVYHDAWVQSLPPYSTIHINGYEGALGIVEVMAAQDSARAHAPDPDITFGSIEPITIDGREALGWEERIDTPTRGIPWVAYRVVVPYDTISYSIEISTEDPMFKAEAPESLRAVVSTFAIGETVYNWPPIAIGVGLLFLLVHTMRQKARAKAERLQSINLVKIERKEDDQPELELELAAVGSGTTTLPTSQARSTGGRGSAE